MCYNPSASIELWTVNGAVKSAEMETIAQCSKGSGVFSTNPSLPEESAKSPSNRILTTLGFFSFVVQQLPLQIGLHGLDATNTPSVKGVWKALITDMTAIISPMASLLARFSGDERNSTTKGDKRLGNVTSVLISERKIFAGATSPETDTLETARKAQFTGRAKCWL